MAQEISENKKNLFWPNCMGRDFPEVEAKAITGKRWEKRERYEKKF